MMKIIKHIKSKFKKDDRRRITDYKIIESPWCVRDDIRSEDTKMTNNISKTKHNESLRVVIESLLDQAEAYKDILKESTNETSNVVFINGQIQAFKTVLKIMDKEI